MKHPVGMITRNQLSNFLGNPRMKMLGYGWDRIVYKVRGLVFKIPKNELGESCNIFEADNWSLAPHERVATRIVLIDNVSIAIQPFLNINIEYNDKPDWASYYDGAQGGLNHNGLFKIYDFPPNFMGNANSFMYN